MSMDNFEEGKMGVKLYLTADQKTNLDMIQGKEKWLNPNKDNRQPRIINMIFQLGLNAYNQQEVKK